MLSNKKIKAIVLGGLMISTAAVAIAANNSQDQFLYTLVIQPNSDPNIDGQETYAIQTECIGINAYEGPFENFTTTQSVPIDPQCSQIRVDVVDYNYPHDAGTAYVDCSIGWTNGSVRYPTTFTITSKFNPADNSYEPTCTITQDK